MHIKVDFMEPCPAKCAPHTMQAQVLAGRAFPPASSPRGDEPAAEWSECFPAVERQTPPYTRHNSDISHAPLEAVVEEK